MLTGGMACGLGWWELNERSRAREVERLVAPERLHSEEGVAVHRHVAQVGPGVLVAGLVPLDVVLAILHHGEVVRIADRLGIFVPDDDAVAIEDRCPEAEKLLPVVSLRKIGLQVVECSSDTWAKIRRSY
jgi:hypothetical protein